MLREVFIWFTDCKFNLLFFVWLSDFKSIAFSVNVKVFMPRVWSPLATSVFKVNVDGAVFSQQRKPGVGAVIRNCEGLFMGALSMKLNQQLGSLEAEAKAYELGILFAKDMGLSSSVLEGDSEVVCRALRVSDWGHSSIREIVKDTVSIVGSLRTFSFSHTRRQGNCATHVLAKRVIVSYPLLVWMEHVPPDVSPFVISDLPFA
ncbi:uncharacterized protein LOC142638762 [Castanea sativa]|uniref:uncharacterized protein LOC142638762 n=1 Tax=Castanea sativa TaxID=21020 RepID=UPI003F653C9E